MKQHLCKANGAAGRSEALKFASGGLPKNQRVAYWVSDGDVYCFERLPGQTNPLWRKADGAWWSATKTVRQALGLKVSH